MSTDDLIYYRERAVVERHRSLTATNPRAAELHAELASLYEKLVELGQSPKPVLHLVDAMSQPMNGA